MDEKYQWQLLDEKNNTKYVITKSVTTVGRNPRANICCSSVIVSKQHAQFLLLVDGTLYIQDNGVLTDKCKTALLVLIIFICFLECKWGFHQPNSHRCQLFTKAE